MYIIIFCISLILCLPARAEAPKDEINITKNDRILVLAPHPDDEAIGTCGIIQRALEQNAKVKIVCYTNGDSNQLAFIVYEKRITFRKGEFLHMGEVRRRETMRAMVSMGVKPEDILFLGYPDFGTLEIFTRYWGDVAPYKSLFTKVSKVSYPEAMSFKAPYSGESILKDIEKIILDFKPTKIFVSHPADTNRDHKSLYLFLQVAVWNLEGKISPPEVFPYIIHVLRWPLPRGYHPEMELRTPDLLANNGIEWHNLALTGEEIKKKHDTISFYKSEIKYNPKYLFTFARKNEIFWDLPAIRISEKNYGDITWEGMEHRQDIVVTDPEHKKDAEKKIGPDVAYAARDGKLFVRFQLKKGIEKDLGVSIFLIGYNNKIDFSSMPKLRITIDTLGLHVKDRKETRQVKDIEFNIEGRVLVLRVPFALLGNPDRILTSAMTHPNELGIEESSWRLVYLQ